jgi:predicted Zn-dependent protease
MSNIYLMPGNQKTLDLLCAVNRGFLLLSCDRAKVYGAAGDFSLEVNKALMIRRGKLAETYTGMVVQGNLQEALLRVAGCSGAADLAPYGTECVKGEALPVGQMAPCILVDGLRIVPR